MLANAPKAPSSATGAAPDKQGVPDNAKQLAQSGDLAIYSIDTPEKLALLYKKGDGMQTLFENDRRPQSVLLAEQKKEADKRAAEKAAADAKKTEGSAK